MTKPAPKFRTKLALFLSGALAIAAGTSGVAVLGVTTPVEQTATIKVDNILAGYNTSQIFTENTRAAQGLNLHGELAINNTTPQIWEWETTDMAELPKKLSGAYSHTAMLTDTGKVYLWGQNDYGQTGSTKNPTITPNQLIVSAPYKKILTANNMTLAIDYLGDLYVWGDVSSYPGTANPEDKKLHLLTDQKFKDIALGKNSIYALNSDGTLLTWGGNEDGQLGLNTTETVTEPTVVPNVAFRNIYAESQSTTVLALDNNGRLFAWGNNGAGQAGVGENWRQQQLDENERVKQEIARIQQNDQTRKQELIAQCQAARDKTLEDALEEYERLNPQQPEPTPEPTPTPTSTVTPTPTPTPSPSQSNPAPVLPTWDKTCAQEVEETFVPTDTSGIVPRTIPEPELKPNVKTPTQIGADIEYVAGAVGTQNAYALSADGTLYGWGSDKNGQSAQQLNENTHTQVPVPAPVTQKFGSLSASGTVAGATSNNTLYLWGTSGPLNPGILGDKQVLVPLTPFANNASKVFITPTAGFYTTPDNDGFMWGANGKGLLGTDGALDTFTSPQPMNQKFNTISADMNAAVGLNNRNQFVYWGTNQSNTFGTGTTSTTPAVVAREEVSSFLDVYAGAKVTLAVDINGIVWVLGDGRNQQTAGNGLAVREAAPIPFPTKVKLVAANLTSAYAVDVNDTVWAWGDGSPTPTVVPSEAKGITTLETNKFALTIIDENKNLWEWSGTGRGVINSTENGVTKISGLSNIKQIAGSGAGFFALNEEGKLYTWGSPFYLSSLEEQSTDKPVLVETPVPLDRISASETHMLATSATGVLYGAGTSIQGALGQYGEFGIPKLSLLSYTTAESNQQ